MSNSSYPLPFISMFIPSVTLINEKSYISDPDSFASPPPNTVPYICKSPISSELSFIVSYPILVLVTPYTTDVFAPPYTFPAIVPDTIFTVLVEEWSVSVPVAALFPPPNTFFPIFVVVPSIVKLVLPYTIAVLPFPPEYKLLSKFEFFTCTYVFPVTVPSFPPPYTFCTMLAFSIFRFVSVFTPALFPPPYTSPITVPLIKTFVRLLSAWSPPPYTFTISPAIICTLVVSVLPP